MFNKVQFNSFNHVFPGTFHGDPEGIAEVFQIVLPPIPPTCVPYYSVSGLNAVFLALRSIVLMLFRLLCCSFASCSSISISFLLMMTYSSLVTKRAFVVSFLFPLRFFIFNFLCRSSFRFAIGLTCALVACVCSIALARQSHKRTTSAISCDFV